MHELVGVDTGGTFTDFILYKNGEFVSYKIPSTPESPEIAILQGLSALNIKLTAARIVHGTTVTTNTLLEGKGAKTAFITNKGLQDILLIGRQARTQLYNLCPQAPRQLIASQHCFALDARVDANGRQIKALSKQELEELKITLKQHEFESVAISMLFSFLNPDDEKQIENLLKDDYFVTRSSKILPEQREYERGVVTWLNSYLGPKTHRYLQKLQSRLSNTVHIMQSDATTSPADYAGQQAVRLLLSGPAGGVMAASVIAKSCQHEKLLTLDMGGTSTDVSLIDCRLKLTNNIQVAEFPLALSLLDIHTIGAGGGSLARVDDAAGLHVGPESAGARPGPACYGHGGQRATITDANVVLGKLPTLGPWDSGLELDKQLAVKALEEIATQLSCSLFQAAQGILDIANAHMAQALRVISIQRGYDPRQFSLFPFGGAAGLHMCSVAKLMGISSILIPNNAGTLSAQGMIYAPVGHTTSRSICQVWEAGLFPHVERILIELTTDAINELKRTGIPAERVEQWVELRYVGQSSSLRFAWTHQTETIAQQFATAHQQRFGFTLHDHPVELVSLRVGAYQDSPEIENQFLSSNSKQAIPLTTCVVYGEKNAVPVFRRADLAKNQTILGPCVILEQTSTLYIDAGWEGRILPTGHIHLQLTTDYP